MRLGPRLRHCWHELYYSLASEGGVQFAMKCKDVTEKIDLDEIPRDPRGRFRFWLHIILCQACKNYLKLSQVLKKAVQTFARTSATQNIDDLDRLSKDLLLKHSKK